MLAGIRRLLPSPEPGDRSARRLLWFAVCLGGWAFAAVIWYTGWRSGTFRFPSGDVAQIFLPAGEAMLSGSNPYAAGVTPLGRPFLYAPPWAVVFGIVAPLGAGPVHVVLSALELLALRYIAGSWLSAGAYCWFLLVPWEIASGQLDLLVAAAIVAAVRGKPQLAAVMGMAKLSPFAAVSPRDLIPFAAALLAFCCLSLPFMEAWVWWIQRLLATVAAPVGPLVPIPFVVRLPVALVLVALWRPWSRALGAAVLTPGLYWSALVVFVAVVPFVRPAVAGLRRGGSWQGSRRVGRPLEKPSMDEQGRDDPPS